MDHIMSAYEYEQILKGLDKGIIDDDELSTDKSLLRINNVEVGEYFYGVVYVVNTTFRRNRNTENYDITFKCIDGDGFTFIMKMFDTDMKTVQKEIIYINKGISVYSHKTKTVYYNVEKITRYKDVKIPVSIFIKKIKNINLLEDKVNLFIEDMKKGVEYADIYNKLDKEYDIRDKLVNSQYSYDIGNRLGSSLIFINNMCSIYKTLSGTEEEQDLEEYRLFILASILYPIIKILSKGSIIFHEAVSEEEIINEIIKIPSPILNIISSSNLKEMSKAKLISILMSDKYKRTPIESRFYSILDIVELDMKLKDLMVNKANVYDNRMFLV